MCPMCRPASDTATGPTGPWNPPGGCCSTPANSSLDPYARALDGKPVLGPELYAHAVDEDLSPTCMPFIPSELDSAGNVALGVVTGEQFPIVPGPKVPEGRTVVYETHVKGFTHDMPDVPPELRALTQAWPIPPRSSTCSRWG